eukprot:5802919-Pleurochrysis_carterae.AAC.1
MIFLKYANVYGDDTFFEHMASKCARIFPHLASSKNRKRSYPENSGDEDEMMDEDKTAHKWEAKLRHAFENGRNHWP